MIVVIQVIKLEYGSIHYHISLTGVGAVHSPLLEAWPLKGVQVFM